MPEKQLSQFDDYLSRYSDRCQGSDHTDRYFVAFNVSAAVTSRQFTHAGSQVLDETNAFDLAEVAEMNLGQLNLLQVSSFCGPEGLIWGYDVARDSGLGRQILLKLTDSAGCEVSVYRGAPLMRAAKELFGTVVQPRFPIAPGSHCPAAWKAAISDQPGTVFACLAFGIPEDRNTHACCIMEDIGYLPAAGPAPTDDWRHEAQVAAARSVLTVLENQGGQCREIFVGLAEATIQENEIGCALLLAPYFRLARQALPEGGVPELKQVSLAEWHSQMTN